MSSNLIIVQWGMFVGKYLPAIAAWRFAAAMAPRRGETEARTDLSRLPKWINEPLFLLTQAERWLLKHMDFPFGSSLLCVARKTSSSLG